MRFKVERSKKRGGHLLVYAENQVDVLALQSLADQFEEYHDREIIGPEKAVVV